MSVANNEEKELQDEDGEASTSLVKLFHADVLAIICICDSDIDDNATIQCDGCGRWQHMRCVGIDPAVVDLEDLVYHCDQCEPRTLDVEAARSYIERYKREEAQSVQPKARRGRGKGSGRRAAANTSSPGARQEPRRNKSNKSIDSDETDDLHDPNGPQSGLRDYTLLDDFVTTNDAASWKSNHLQDYPLCPSTIDIDGFSTIAKLIPNSGGQVRGLFSERDAPSNAFVGRFLGVVNTRSNYEKEPQNMFKDLQGPLNFVIFVQQSELVVDARKSGNDARYIRKSCTPNCTLVPLILEPSAPGSQPAWQFLLALKENIRKGEELTIGFQWPAQDPADVLKLRPNADISNFVSEVASVIGDCACTQSPTNCHIRKWRVESNDAVSRKRSPSVAEGTTMEESSEPVLESKTLTMSGLAEVPMTREERKIQMAIARMENADAPRTKRRRRNTGDENSRPIPSRRASSQKGEEANGTGDEPRHSPSPPPMPVKESKSSKSTFRSRARLIRPPSPEYSVSETVPRKLLWLRTFSTEKVIKEEQRLKLAEQAREATARLAEEASRKKLEIEALAKEARELREKDAEIERRRVEKEAKEASQRAREREIWGDHPGSAIVMRPTGQDNVVNDHIPSRQSSSGQGQLSTNADSRLDSPTSMGPPTLPRESSKSSPPATVIPKIVRKLSVSEYIRQKKEKEAASESSSSPNHENFKPQREIKVEADAYMNSDDRSDGEIDAGELEPSRQRPQQSHPLVTPPLGPRGEFLQPPPTAPKAASQYNSQPFQSPPTLSAHPVRNYGPPPVQQSSHPTHFSQYNRHSLNQDQRQGRPINGYGPQNSYSNHPNNNNHLHNNNSQRPTNMIPTGPKFSRTNSMPDNTGNNNSKPYPNS